MEPFEGSERAETFGRNNACYQLFPLLLVQLLLLATITHSHTHTLTPSFGTPNWPELKATIQSETFDFICIHSALQQCNKK